MIADGLNLHTIQLNEGEKIPNDLNKFDGMFCMGGPMDTFMEKEYPWLIEEKKKIKEFVIDLKKPYLGFCLGCSLLRIASFELPVSFCSSAVRLLVDRLFLS